VAKLNGAGSALVYSTYLGGSGNLYSGYGGDNGNAIAVDSSGNAYVTGGTGSTDFPVTAGAFQTNYGGNFNAFVAMISQGVSVHPDSLTFGPQDIDTTSPPQTATLTNTGNATFAVSSILASGDFAQTNTCGGSVAAGGSCNISLTFTPTSFLTRTGTLTITDSGANNLQTVALSGTGLGVRLNPASLNFGNQAENTPSATQAVTLYNTQSTALAISVTASGDFAQTNTCGSSVPAGSRCTISVTYTPSILGVETGTLTVTDSASNNPQTATLAGRGVLQAQLSTPSVAFAAQTVGSTSPPWNVLFGNNLSTALPISITFTGADPGDFAQTNTCGASLAPRSMCTISLTFTPTATGTRTATLTVTDSANNSPQTMALTGTGQ